MFSLEASSWTVGSGTVPASLFLSLSTNEMPPTGWEVKRPDDMGVEGNTHMPVMALTSAHSRSSMYRTRGLHMKNTDSGFCISSLTKSV